MPEPRLVCLGNFTIDDIILPDGTERLDCTGGDALYAALAARLFEPRTEIVAPVGTDLPKGIIAQIEAAGLSLDGLPQRRLPTLHNRVTYDRSGGRSWALWSSDADFHSLSPTPSDIPKRYCEAEAFLVLAMTLPAQEDLVTWMQRETSALIALDPQEDYIVGNEDRLLNLIARVDIFLPSSDEVRRLLGHDDWPAASRRFADLGPRIVALKLGGAGCYVYDAASERDFYMAAHPAAPVDTTGAGDSFCGAFMGALLQDRTDLEGVARAAVTAASFAVAGYGTDGIFAASPSEVFERLREAAPARRDSGFSSTPPPSCLPRSP